MADATTLKMALLWVKVQDHIWLESIMAFPDFEGKLVKHLERKMEMAARTRGHNLPTPTLFRKELEIRNKRLRWSNKGSCVSGFSPLTGNSTAVLSGSNNGRYIHNL